MSKNVTTHQKTCSRCSEEYQPTSNRQKYCGSCQRELNKERCTARYRRTYERKGYNQAGANNNAYKSGIGNYSKVAFSHYGRKCTEVGCGSKKHLCVHHKDEDRKNNELSNLEVLCRSCHAKRHELHLNFTREEGIVCAM